MARGQSIDIVTGAQVMNMGDAGMTPTQIAAETGLARTTIQGILSKHGRWGEIAEKPVFVALRQEQQTHMEAALRAGARLLFEHAFDSDKLAKASTYQLVISTGIALDKARLLAGEPTEIISQVTDRRSVEALDALASALSQALTASKANEIDITPKASKP